MKRFLLRIRGYGSSSNGHDSNRAKIDNSKKFILNCPHCQYSQEVLFSGISTFCKNCQKVINLEKVFHPQSIPNETRPALKKVICFQCKNEQAIPNKALSSFCKKCGKRINLQNYKITGKFNGSLETQGTLHVTPSGELRSNIVCYSAIVEGKISGNLRAINIVELRETATMKGSIQAEKLVMEEGAAFKGTGKITPQTG